MMNELHNRGSPRLQFTERELKNDALSRAIAKAESASERYDVAQMKLKKHYRLKLTREAINDSKAAAQETSEDESSAMQPDEILEDIKVDFGTGAKIEPFGGFESGEIRKAISAMEKDSVLHEYQYFVGNRRPETLVDNADGMVMRLGA